MSERDNEIEFTLKAIRLLLRERGDDPNKYNPKYLRDKAIQCLEGFKKQHPDAPIVLDIASLEDLK